MLYDLAIIGGGPAGTAAGVYASRKQLPTLFITKDWGGQSTVSPDIQNWIGSPHISGDALAKSFKDHLMTYAGDVVTIADKKEVTSVAKADDGSFTIAFADGTTAQSKALLIATGSNRRRLAAENADRFEHKGLTYCASCDGPIFAGQDVVVIGGGNAGFETAAQLLAYAKSVTLLHRGPAFKADPVTVEKVLAHPNMRGVLNAETVAIEGEQFVSGIRYKDATNGAETTLAATGIFVEVGMIPNTELVANLLERDEYGRIVIDPWTQKTTTPGVWAAGDCTNIKYHQNNISAGDAVRALEDIYVTLKTK
jgi:NADH-dependent peroxiredoxin subunit F